MAAVLNKIIRNSIVFARMHIHTNKINLTRNEDMYCTMNTRKKKQQNNDNATNDEEHDNKNTNLSIKNNKCASRRDRCRMETSETKNSKEFAIK